MKQTTHLDLLNRLPSPIREQAIEAIKNQHGENADAILNQSRCASLWSLLEHTNIINWAKTPQGHKYWLEISRKVSNGEFDDPSVTLPREDWEALIAYVKEDQMPQEVHKVIEAIQSQLTK
jgi:hypothetical protein